MRRFGVAVGVLLVTAQAGAQAPSPVAPDFAAGGEMESYLRALQISGRADWYPWGIRGFSPRELARMLCSDSVAISHAGCAASSAGRVTAAVRGGAIFNSTFPYRANDGPVWAGRGATITASPSVAVRAGPLNVVAAPLVFWAANASFPLADNGQPPSLAYGHSQFPRSIDLPQRFGDEPYSRVDPGNSSVRIDTRFVTAGLSTANMVWGPAVEHAFVLSNNAAGFPHAFLGTGHPVNIWIGRVHARLMWGQLSQSPYSPVSGSDRFVSRDEPGRKRLMTGAVLLFAPRPIPNLELGVSRFSHVAYPQGGFPKGFWTTPFSQVFQQSYDFSSVDANELASFFGRWVFPRSGFEFYAEYGREDHAYDLRELIQDPEHQRAYLLGFQKTVGNSDRRLNVIRGELMSYLLHPSARDREEGPIYTHGVLAQGHTHRGQLLGSSAGAGNAAASSLAWDRYNGAGKTTVVWRRIVRGQRGHFHATGVEDEHDTDVLHALGAQRSRTSGQLTQTMGLEFGYNFSREFRWDAGNLSARYELRWALP